MSAGILLLRLAVGLTLAAHGAQKLFGAFGGHGLEGTAQFLESLGFRPGRLHAWALGAGELVGGIMLATGLLTPLGAAAVIGVMAVAALVVHRPHGFFAENGGYEYPVTLALAAEAVAFTGPGRFSIDHLAGWHLAGPGWGLAAAAIAAIAAGVVLAGRAVANRSGDRGGAPAPAH
jgi:putative oxidoreductase